MAVPAPATSAPTSNGLTLDELRDQLAAESRAKKKPSSASASPLPLTAYPGAFELAVDQLTAPSATTAQCVLGLQVIELLLAASLATVSSPELTTLYTPSFVSDLAVVLYVAYEKAGTAMLVRCKGGLLALIALEDAQVEAGLRDAADRVTLSVLRERLIVDPWLAKRSMFIFDILIGELPLDAFAPFAVGDRGTPAGVLAKLVNVMAISDELTTVAGKVAIDRKSVV